MDSHRDAVRFRLEDDGIGYLQIHRPETDNAINQHLVDALRQTLATHHRTMRILVLEGLPHVFCIGAELDSVAQGESCSAVDLYDLWVELSHGHFITVAHVRGKAQAGGIGFVSACDIVLADTTATFALPEMIFGLFPACVLPFLVRRVGRQKAHYMTLMNAPVEVEDAHRWGLVDAFAGDSVNLLRRHLLRLRRLSKSAITAYKSYRADLDPSLATVRDTAVEANRQLFSNPEHIADIVRFVQTGEFPWQ